MKVCKAILYVGLVLSAVAPVSFSGSALAQQDTSSNVVNGFNQVSKGKGLMIRVPVNAQGQEDGRLAEVRVPFDSAVSGNDVNQLAKAFDSSTSVAPAMFNITDDSSISIHTFGYGRYWNYNYYNAWQQPYYFYNYNWGYSYNNFSYGYRTPFCNTIYSPYVYNNFNYYGYRYYYYPAAW